MLNYIEEQELYGKSNYDIMTELGRRFHDYRVAVGMTQKEAAEKCGTNVMTVSRFESGNAGSIRLTTFIGMLRALSILENIYSTIPELPTIGTMSPGKAKSSSRVRKPSI